MRGKRKVTWVHFTCDGHEVVQDQWVLVRKPSVRKNGAQRIEAPRKT